MNPAIDVIGKERCTGCFGCLNACDFNAITMPYDKDGFFTPEVDREKCTDCGLCQNHCPVIVLSSTPDNNLARPHTFGARSNDPDLVKKSSSGGIFGELARMTIHEGGVVYGAAWDRDLNLGHRGIEALDRLHILFGSKYVQSNIKKSYLEVRDLAQQGRRILFCGTPCQIAALRTFVDPVPFITEKLITCDLICHGVPSTSFFKMYLAYLKDRYKGDITSVLFRSKERGWVDYSMRVTFSNGHYSKPMQFDPFLIGFLKDYCLRPSCHDCSFCRLPRLGDISLGDLWGASKSFYSHYGVSCVLVNNNKALDLYNLLINDNSIKSESYPLEPMLRGNMRISAQQIEMPALRDRFLLEMNEKPFSDLKKAYLENHDFYGYFVLKLKLLYKRFRYRF